MRRTILSVPGFITPMKATLVEDFPQEHEEAGWVYEKKFDGYRTVCVIKGGTARLYSLKGLDVTDRYPAIKAACDAIGQDMVLDGEIVAVNHHVKSSFEALQLYLKTGQGTVMYSVFDLLYYQDRLLVTVPLEQRLSLLQSVLPPFVSPVLQLTEFTEDGPQLLKRAQKEDWEGIIGKQKNSLYEPGKRSRDWIKLKTTRRQELIICGFTKPFGNRKYFGSVLLGVYVNDQLHYAGKCGSGFDEATLRHLYHRMKENVQDTSPFREKIEEEATWLHPRLVAEIRFSEWTAEGKLRHSSFLGLREDKDARTVVVEIPQKA